MQHQLIITEDGSHSLFVLELKEHYHSTFGALQESMHIFIQAGFNCIEETISPVSILEIGFGTGLNAILTYSEAKHKNKAVKYTAIEAYPVEYPIYSSLNYCTFINDKEAETVFNEMHKADWNQSYHLSDSFIIDKIEDKMEQVALGADRYDLVYFDAFAPDVQPELWTKEVFEKIFFSMKKNGMLLTYSAKGEVKRTLKFVGFTVEGIKGPKGKREITRAVKCPCN